MTPSLPKRIASILSSLDSKHIKNPAAVTLGRLKKGKKEKPSKVKKASSRTNVSKALARRQQLFEQRIKARIKDPKSIQE